MRWDLLDTFGSHTLSTQGVYSRAKFYGGHGRMAAVPLACDLERAGWVGADLWEALFEASMGEVVIEHSGPANTGILVTARPGQPMF